eukprot:GAHX01001682.1.p1 GENE.GAHX01001682.1~~GAHX01001682.1.p1  ORF type:complete len:718 (+),score=155.70 GAHX01001682.1:82-2235(+)
MDLTTIKYTFEMLKSSLFYGISVILTDILLILYLDILYMCHFKFNTFRILIMFYSIIIFISIINLNLILFTSSKPSTIFSFNILIDLFTILISILKAYLTYTYTQYRSFISSALLSILLNFRLLKILDSPLFARTFKVINLEEENKKITLLKGRLETSEHLIKDKSMFASKSLPKHLNKSISKTIVSVVLITIFIIALINSRELKHDLDNLEFFEYLNYNLRAPNPKLSFEENKELTNIYLFNTFEFYNKIHEDGKDNMMGSAEEHLNKHLLQWIKTGYQARIPINIKYDDLDLDVKLSNVAIRSLVTHYKHLWGNLKRDYKQYFTEYYGLYYTFTFYSFYMFKIISITNITITVILFVFVFLMKLILNILVQKYVYEPLKRLGERVTDLINNTNVDYDKEGKDNNIIKEAYEVEQSVLRINYLIRSCLSKVGNRYIKNFIYSPVEYSRRIECIILFCDVRNFTMLTEKLKESVFILINKIAEIIHKNVILKNGTISKNVGDAFLNIWEITERDPDMEDDEIVEEKAEKINQAIFVALKCIREIKLNPYLSKENVKIGFGLHLGHCVEGVLGTKYKTDTIHTGRDVEVAELLEEKTKQYNVPLVISRKAFNASDRKIKDIFRYLGDDDFTLWSFSSLKKDYVVKSEVPDYVCEDEPLLTKYRKMPSTVVIERWNKLVDKVKKEGVNENVIDVIIEARKFKEYFARDGVADYFINKIK